MDEEQEDVYDNIDHVKGGEEDTDDSSEDERSGGPAIIRQRSSAGVIRQQSSSGVGRTGSSSGSSPIIGVSLQAGSGDVVQPAGRPPLAPPEPPG